MRREIVTGLPGELMRALAERILDWRRGASLDRIVVLTLDAPTHSALYDRLPLAVANGAGDRAGLFNVELRTLSSFASELTREGMEADGVRPLPHNASPLVVAEAVRGTLGATSRLAGSVNGDDLRLRPSFTRAMLSAIIDMKKAGWRPEDCRKRGDSRYRQEIAAIYEASEEFLRTHHFADPTDILTRATDQIRHGALAGIRGVALYGVRALNAAERGVVEAVARSGTEVSVYVPHLADAPSFALSDLTISQLTTALDCGTTAIDSPRATPRVFVARDLTRSDRCEVHSGASISFVSAADAAGEWLDTARHIWALVGDDPTLRFSDIHVVAPRLKAVRSIARDAFAAAGIPVNWLGGTPLDETEPARSLLRVLDVIDSRFSRASVMELLTTVRLPERLLSTAFGAVSPPEWDRILRLAGIVGTQIGERESLSGAVTRTWIDPLTAYADHLRRRADKAEDAAEEGGVSPAHLRRDAEFTDHLVEIIGLLRDRLSALVDAERAGSWSTWIDALRKAWDLVDEPEPSDARGRVNRLLDEFANYDADLPLPSGVACRDLVRDALAGAVVPVPVGDPSPRGSGEAASLDSDRGVVISDVAGAVHRSPRIVVVTGLVDGAYPDSDAQRPLAALSEQTVPYKTVSGVRTIGKDLAESYLDFALLLTAARDGVRLSYARAQPGEPERQIACSLFLDAAGRALSDPARGTDASGPRNGAAWSESGLREALGTESWLHRSAIPRSVGGRRYLNEHEFDLTSAALLNDPGNVVRLTGNRGVPLLVARRNASDSPYDGRIADEAVRGRILDDFRARMPTSATRIEAYATCPFRYFVQRVLGVEPMDEPERLLAIDGLTRGSIIHDLLAGFLRETVAEGVSLAGIEESELRDRFSDYAARRESEETARWSLSSPMMWDAEWDELCGRAWNAVALLHAEAGEWAPKHFELAFGAVNAHRDVDPASDGEPITIDVDGEQVTLQGVIDRVDVSSGGSARVVDYKSGKYVKPAFERLDGGRTIQLVAYALGLEHWLQRHDGGEVAEALYHYLREPLPDDPEKRKGSSQVDVRDAEMLSAEKTDLTDVLQAVLTGIRSGAFHPLPGERPSYDRDTCAYCDVQSACGSLIDLERRWRAMSDAEFTRPFTSVLRGKVEKRG